MKKELEIFNLNHCNPTVLQIKQFLRIHKIIWVGFDSDRYFLLDETLLERFIQNFRLEENDLIEEIF